MNCSLWTACGIMILGTVGCFSGSSGDNNDHADASREHSNKQVLADTFRHLVRYALLKTNRDPAGLGVTPACFTDQTVEESLLHRSNADIFSGKAPAVARLLERAHATPVQFHFNWQAPGAPERSNAEFNLSYEPDGDLKVRLLVIAIPEKIPVSPQAGIISGRKPFAEAVQELVRLSSSGRLEPYPAPR